MTAFRTLVLLTLAGALAGCLGGILPKAGARAVYTLPDPDPATAHVARPLPGALLVETPRALAPFDSQDIVVVRADGEIQVLPGVRWAAPAPELLQDLIARQIEAAGVAPSVAQSAQAYQLPLRLASELRAFAVHEDGAILSTHAAISAKLVCTRDARILAASAPIAVDASPVPNNPAAATAALRDTAAQLARQVTLWLSKVDASSCADR